MKGDHQEEILRYYWRELTYLRKAGAAFAEKYPKVAGRLDLGASGETADPHVERLIEAFAFLTGRIQHNLDSDFPEIASELLNLLYPHYLNPVPSLAIARFEVDPERGKITTGHLLPKHTPLFAQSAEGKVCRFRTCYPVTLWPLAVTYAGFESTAQFDFLDRDTGVTTVLRLRLSGPLSGLALDRLRFFLNGDRLLVDTLYELLFGHLVRVVLLPGGAPGAPVFLPPGALLPVGFAADEEVLPYPPPAHPGYRLLQEYFVFPEKFLFFDLDDLGRLGTLAAGPASQQGFDVLFLFDQSPKDRLYLDAETFLLGCTPVANLFARPSEPIRLDQRRSEYPLVADARRERETEIHSILKVSASADLRDESRVFAPFYSFSHRMGGERQRAFWHARRMPTGRADLPGTQMVLSLLDLDWGPHLPAVDTIYAHTLCTNRDLAEQLPAGALLQTDVVAPVKRISCLAKPTQEILPPAGGANLWRLVSHLSLNYLSLSADGRGDDGRDALREILRLYSPAGDATAERQILGLAGMSCRKVVRRMGGEAWRGFCRGSEITLVFDEDAYVGSSAFLLASVLNRFFALYASMNSFTQLVIQSHQRHGAWKRWPPVAGEQILL